jgi:hypothetical protein
MNKKLKGFNDDKEKMKDFYSLTKEEFLKSYSYLTEEEYILTAKQRLENLREKIKKECISQGEILELQRLKDYIEDEDVRLLEWAGVLEFERE